MPSKNIYINSLDSSDQEKLQKLKENKQPFYFVRLDTKGTTAVINQFECESIRVIRAKFTRSNFLNSEQIVEKIYKQERLGDLISVNVNELFIFDIPSLGFEMERDSFGVLLQLINDEIPFEQEYTEILELFQVDLDMKYIFINKEAFEKLKKVVKGNISEKDYALLENSKNENDFVRKVEKKVLERVDPHILEKLSIDISVPFQHPDVIGILKEDNPDNNLPLIQNKSDVIYENINVCLRIMEQGFDSYFDEFDIPFQWDLPSVERTQAIQEEMKQNLLLSKNGIDKDKQELLNSLLNDTSIDISLAEDYNGNMKRYKKRQSAYVGFQEVHALRPQIERYQYYYNRLISNKMIGFRGSYKEPKAPEYEEIEINGMFDMKDFERKRKYWVIYKPDNATKKIYPSLKRKDCPRAGRCLSGLCFHKHDGVEKTDEEFREIEKTITSQICRDGRDCTKMKKCWRKHNVPIQVVDSSVLTLDYQIFLRINGYSLIFVTMDNVFDKIFPNYSIFRVKPQQNVIFDVSDSDTDFDSDSDFEDL